MRTFILYSNLDDIKSKRVRCEALRHIARVYKRRETRRPGRDLLPPNCRRSSRATGRKSPPADDSAIDPETALLNGADRVELPTGAIDDIFPGAGYSVDGTDWQPFDTDLLSKLTEHFFQVMGPSSVWSFQRTSAAPKTPCRNATFALLLKEESVLLAVTLLGQTFLTFYHPDSGATPANLVASLQLRTITSLHKRLSTTTPTNISEGLLFTVAALITTSVLREDWTTFEVNFSGFEKLTELWGGISAVPPSGWFTSFQDWSKLCGRIYKANASMERSRPKSTYPEHPFSPDLCSALASQPSGIRELALSRTLSYDLLAFIREVCRWTNEYDDTLRDEATLSRYHFREHQLATQLVSVLEHSLKLREQVFCVALFAYITSADRRAPPHRIPRGLALYLIGLNRLQALSSLMETFTDDLLWTAVVIAASNDAGLSDTARDWFLTWLLECNPMKQDELGWSQVSEILQNFFWNASMEKAGREAWTRVLKKLMEGRPASSQLGRESLNGGSIGFSPFYNCPRTIRGTA